MNANTFLDQRIVLVLNRSWQAVHSRSVAEAILQIMAGAATPLDIGTDGSMVPVKNWAQWMKLPVREHDKSIGTVHGQVRVPTVIVCCAYNKVPMKRPSFSPRAIRVRDAGRCQYTGKLLAPDEMTIDHVVPKSRLPKGTANRFDNCVLAHKDVNNRKANRTPEEAGLKLLKAPKIPTPVPVTLTIRNPGVPDWEPFLKR